MNLYGLLTEHLHFILRKEALHVFFQQPDDIVGCRTIEFNSITFAIENIHQTVWKLGQYIESGP